MDLWQTEMLAGNFANAAMVYTETGVLTVGGTSYIGRTQIEGFFAAFAPTATAVGYAITSVGTDTFSDVYDFGAAGTHDYVINLAHGTADIVREVVTVQVPAKGRGTVIGSPNTAPQKSAAPQVFAPILLVTYSTAAIASVVAI